MAAINDVQLILQNLLKRIISQAEIGKALGTGRANISLRMKNNSILSGEELSRLEHYFGIPLIEIIENAQSVNDNAYKPDGRLFYDKLLCLLNSADDIELEFYYNVVKQCQKSINTLRAK